MLLYFYCYTVMIYEAAIMLFYTSELLCYVVIKFVNSSCVMIYEVFNSLELLCYYI